MKLQIASDLHLEFPKNREWLEKNPIMPMGDVLLLAGDVVTERTKSRAWAKKFFHKLEKEFSFIISVMGNHEFYHGHLDFAYPSYIKSRAENHLLINNKVHTIGDVRFLASTLWSNVPPESFDGVEACMNDYSLIKNISVEKTVWYHEQSVAFLKAELAKPFNGKTVVLTHHLPSYKCISEQMHDYLTNPAYASHLDDLILNSKIDLWAHGHSHDFCDIRIGNTRVVRNPMGYPGQEQGFYRDFAVEV